MINEILPKHQTLKKKRGNLFWDGNNKMAERYRKKIKN